jgi:hypothetical protein
MPRAGFEVWLARRYPEHMSTVRARFSNVARIESAYGSLEGHYQRDRCASIFAELRFSGADYARGFPNPSRLPIDGNAWNGLVTLRGALKLYVAYLDEAAGRHSGLRPRSRRTSNAEPMLQFGSRPAAQQADGGVPEALPPAAPVPAGEARTALGPRVLAILGRYTAVKDELTALGVLRTGNIVGEYGEWLFARAFGWRLTPPSEKSHDAVDDGGLRYQIKARQDAGRGGAHQLGIIRNMADDGWTAIAAVIFERDFAARLAVIGPREVVAERAVFSGHQHGHTVRLDQGLIRDPRVRDVTADLRAAQA